MEKVRSNHWGLAVYSGLVAAAVILLSNILEVESTALYKIDILDSLALPPEEVKTVEISLKDTR